MIRERALKVVLVIVGLLFVATVYPLLFLVRHEETLQMMLSIYVTLGVFCCSRHATYPHMVA